MLENVRILDMTRVLAGPLSAMMLADLGAQVIKVERPVTGDETRGWGPPFDSRGESAYFLSVNRNKLSIAIDLDAPADHAVLRHLISHSDVVIDNFRAGTLERRGFRPEQFLADQPGLIWCTLSGFGPVTDRPGYDFVVQAESGWMSVTGEVDGEPMKVGVALADVIAGKDAAIAILAALAARPRARPDNEDESRHTSTPGDSRERRLHISLAHSAVSSLVNVAQNVLVNGGDARRWGNAHPNLVPYQLFRAADRPFVIAVGSDAQWRSCSRVLALDSFANDESLVTNAGRLADRDRVVSAIAERVRERPAGDWIRLLTAAGVPCGVVRTVAEALTDVDASAVTGVGPSPPGTVRLPPPRLDEHGSLIRQLGWRAFSALTPSPGLVAGDGTARRGSFGRRPVDTD